MSRILRRTLAPSALVVLILLLPILAAVEVASGAPAAPADGRQKAGAAPAFLLQWGSKGTGSGQFDGPGSVAVDDDGNVYVTDVGNDRVQKFDADGLYLGQWGSKGAGAGQFESPSGIAFYEGNEADPAHYVYVVDGLNNRVQKFRPDGTFVTKWGKMGDKGGEFLVPHGIAVGPSGNVYVVDAGRERIQKFSPSGVFLAMWGSRGGGDGQFNSANSIVVDSRERVYVTDHGYPSRIEVFSAGGAFIEGWTSFGVGTDASFTALGIAVDVSDNVYVTDMSNWMRIMKFTSGGTAITQWVLHAPGDAYAPNAFGVAVARSGEVYVTDANNQCVKKYGRAPLPPDHVPPVTTVKGLDKKWHNTPVTLTFTATDNAGGAGVDYSEARLQDWLLPLWGPWTKGPTYVVPASGDHSDDGDRTVQYRSVDLAGNVEKEKQVKVLIDTRAPKVTVQPATARHDKTAVIKFKVQDQLSPQFKVLAEVLDAAGTVVHSATSKWMPRKGANGWSFICRLRPGKYDTRITATDRAGNSSDPPGLGTLTVK